MRKLRVADSIAGKVSFFLLWSDPGNQLRFSFVTSEITGGRMI